MIIKRITQKLLNQSWGELLVEILVVIVGVFLAIQVENWNEARKELVQEEALLESLYADLAENKNIGERYIDRYSEVERDALKLLEIAKSEQEPTTSDFYSTINGTFATRPPRFISNTWDVLTASGQLTIIQNADIKEEVADLYQLLEGFSQALAQRAEVDREEMERFLMDRLDYRRFVYALHPEDLSFPEFDNEEVVMLDPSVRAELENLSMRGWHTARDFRLNLTRTLESRQAIENSLAEELKRFD